jgi:hypothetical protein
MQPKLLGNINVNFDATVLLLIIYSAFVNYLRRNGNIMKKDISYDSARREAFYNILTEFCIPIKTDKVNSVSE